MKEKFTHLMQIMLEKTDEEHGLSVSEIVDELAKRGCRAERKSIYSDFAEMDKFGIEIVSERVGRDTLYHVNSREFEFAEVKLLIDAIQASKFITEKKSRELIEKIKHLVSEHQAAMLQRQVYISDRVKTMNENILINVDLIHSAISKNHQISFCYYTWNIKKKLVPKHGENNLTIVSPWLLVWEDENYYLVAFDEKSKEIKYYRVDKMKKMSVLEETRNGKKEMNKSNISDFSKAVFGMYGGEKTQVKIRFPEELCGVFIDRFGTGLMIIPKDDGLCEVNVTVCVSMQFFGWVFSLGPKVKIMGPENVANEMKTALEKALKGR